MSKPAKVQIEKPRIAIIGAGIGGCSCAYFLSKLFKNQIHIQIFEKSDQIGGRIDSFEYNGRCFEAGGTILHPKNFYMNEFLKISGLEKSRESKCRKTFFGLFNSNGLVYENLGNFLPFLDQLHFLYKFGIFQTIRLFKWIENFIDIFSRIYRLQDNGFTFSSVDEFLQKLDPRFQEMTKSSFRNLLKNEKLSDELSQFGSAACLVNYNQNADIHGFVGLVSLAGADSNLWNVKSRVGNRDIPLSLFRLSGSSLLLNTMVLGLKQDNEEICLTFVNEGTERNVNFDYVVIAFPLNKNVKNFDLGFDFDYANYEMQLTKTYFIEGNVCLYPQVPINRRNELISCDDSIDFRSVSIQLPCDYSDKTDSKLWLDKNKKLYKVFSRIDLEDEKLRKIFSSDYKIVKKIDWYAYPKYDSLINEEKRKEFPPVIIDSKEKRVFYANSIEWSASCMETSCISARNIALMISKKEQNFDKTIESNTKFCKNSSPRIFLRTAMAILFLLFSYFIKQFLNF